MTKIIIIMKIATQVKRLIKYCIQIVAAKFGRHTRKHESPQLMILMYHRILPEVDERSRLEEPGMVVTPETFKMHLKVLSEYFEFINLSDWIKRKKNGLPLPLKACAITFDDGWSDNYEFAFPILKELNIPATIFLVSEMINTNRMFWPERLALTISAITNKESKAWDTQITQWIRNAETSFAFSDTTPTREQLSEIIAHVKQFTDEEIHILIDQLLSKLDINITNKPNSLLNWPQVQEMLDSGLIEMGSHTCTHTRLNDSLTDAVLEYEIFESKKQLQAEISQNVTSFCFPNGDVSEKSIKLVQESYHCAVTTKNGWNTTEDSDHQLKRIGIHNDIASNSTRFLARLADWGL